MALPTILDIAIATGVDPLIGLIDETIKAHPELQCCLSLPLKGRVYKTRVRTALGRVTGSFRSGNEGTAPIKHVYENHQVECAILNPQFQVDAAIADGHPDGPELYIASEREGILEGEFQGLASQFYYGSSNHAKGFPGLIDAYDSTNMVVDAGGTTANAGSSVWIVRTSYQDVLWRWGDQGSLTLTQPRIIPVIPDSTNPSYVMPAYWSYMLAYPGLQIGRKNTVARIKKLTTETGHTLTDDLIAQAIALFPVAFPPTCIFMNRRSRAQLQRSRTVTLFGNARDQGESGNAMGSSGAASGTQGLIAPLPTEAQGVPIYVTDSILNTESLTL